MAYTPNDLTVYTAAYSGVISGFVASGRIILDGVPTDYSGEAMISGAFAQAFDLAWEVNPDTIPPDTLQVMIIEKACKGVWENRNTEVSSNSLLPESYTELCNGIIALVIASESFVNGQGITPDPWPGGGTGTVDSVNAGAGIAVTGPATDPIVSNTGVLAVTAGTNITVSGTASNPIVNNNGVRSVTAGSNVTIGGTANNPVINSTASGGSGTVTSVAAGPGISVTGSPTVTPTVNNTGVLDVTAGTNVTITGSAQHPIVNASSDPTGNNLASLTGGAAASATPTMTSGSFTSQTGTVLVSAVLWITTTGGGSLADGDSVAYNLLRDAAVIGPEAIVGASSVNGGVAVDSAMSLTWIDTVAPGTSHTWSIKATIGGGHTASISVAGAAPGASVILVDITPHGT